MARHRWAMGQIVSSWPSLTNTDVRKILPAIIHRTAQRTRATANATLPTPPKTFPHHQVENAMREPTTFALLSDLLNGDIEDLKTVLHTFHIERSNEVLRRRFDLNVHTSEELC